MPQAPRHVRGGVFLCCFMTLLACSAMYAIKGLLDTRSETSAGRRFEARFVGRQRRRTLHAATSLPVVVAVMTDHHFKDGSRGGPLERRYAPCTVAGTDIPIDCQWVTAGARAAEGAVGADGSTADVLAYHGPHSCGLSPRPLRPGQLTAMFSAESALYYGCQADQAWLTNFDITMTFKLNSTAPWPYLNQTYVDSWQSQPVVPTAEKLDALAFVNSNCRPPSNRTAIIQDIMDSGLVRVDSFGSCLRNQDVDGRLLSKHAVYRKYKFCVAIENSIEEDYVTEKVYDGLQAGCLPIYLGSPNIAQFLPHPQAALVYENTEQILREMLRLMADTAEYERRVLSWRHTPVERLPDSFQRLLALRQPIDAPCRVCQAVIEQRAREQLVELS